MDTVVLIPAYKPDMRLCVLAESLKKSYLVLIVDDGSGREYDGVFEACKAHATVLRYENNRGKGGAMKYAFEKIPELFPDALCIVTADADGQHTAEDIEKTASAQKEKGGLVLGSRAFCGDVPFKSKWGNAITRFVFSVASGKRVYDTQTGLRAFGREYLDEFSVLHGDRYEYEMTMLMYAAENKIPITDVEIETIYVNNNEGSHFNPFKDSLRIYGVIYNNSTFLKCITSSLLSFFLEVVVLTLLSKFVFTGNAVVPAVLRGTPLEEFFDPAFVISWIISSFFNYNLNRVWVFRSDIKYIKGLAGYYSLAIVTFFVKFLIYGLFKNILAGIPSDVVKNDVSDIIAATFMYIINYIVQKKVLFKKK